MKQITRSSYAVNPGEVITVEVVATKVGNFVTFVVDGVQQPPTGTSPNLTFQFNIMAPPGNIHFSMVDCFFPNAAPSDARYDVFITGSLGGGRIQASDILKKDLVHRRGFDFHSM